LKVLVVTGTLAYEAVRRYAGASSVDVEVVALPRQVAALMTSQYAAEALASRNLAGFDLILVPGMVMGDALQIRERTGVPAFKGPKHAADLPATLNNLGKVRLSTTKPACEILGPLGRRSALEELRLLRSEIQPVAPERANFAIDSGVEKVWVGGGLPPLVLAEIVNAPSLDAETLRRWARYYVESGADIIDVGMTAGGGAPLEAAKAVRTLKRSIKRPISIDSHDVEEIEAAVEAGADLILSVDAENMSAVSKFASSVPVVVTPTSRGGAQPTGAAERVELLEKNIAQAKSLGFTKIIGDLVLNPPLLPSLLGSLRAYSQFAERNPDVPLLMGVGNVTEMVDADSVGVNFLLATLGFELGAALLFTTEASDKTRGSVRELSTALQMLLLARRRESPPKDLGVDLLLLKEKRRREMPAGERRPDVKSIRAKEAARFVYDPKGCFKITLDRKRGEIVLYHYPRGSTKPQLAIRGRRPQELYSTAIEGGLLSSLSHAAYLGAELEKASVALSSGRSYVQDE